MWLASWHADIIQQISHLIKSNDDQIFLPNKSKLITLFLDCLQVRGQEVTHAIHVKKKKIPQSSTLKRA